MAIKAAIRAYLLADGTLSSLVGSRVFSVISATKAGFPRITYLRTSLESVENLSGVAPSLKYENYNFIYHGDSITELDTVADRVKALLDAAKDITQDGVLIRRCLLDSHVETSTYLDGREKPIYEITQAWRVAHNA